MKKYTVLVVVAFVVFFCFVPLVSASYVCPAQLPFADGSTYQLHALFPNSNTYTGGLGTAFTANATCYMQTVDFRLYRQSAPDGYLIARLYAAGGVVGTNAYPSGSALDSSTPIEAATIAGVEDDVRFTFVGSYQIISGGKYVIVIETLNGTNWGITNQMRVSTVTSVAGFNSVKFSESAWQLITPDIEFCINADTVSTGATPTPTPPSSSGGSDGGDAAMEALTNALLPILVPLLIVLIPAFLGLKFVGTWGFMAGLNIGVIIAYVVLAGTTYAFPLWGVVFVGIVDVLLVMKARG